MIGVAPELEAEVDVQLPLDCVAGVSAPQSGECLANRPHGVLNYSVSSLRFYVGDVPCPILLCKGPEYGDWVSVKYE